MMPLRRLDSHPRTVQLLPQQQQQRTTTATTRAAVAAVAATLVTKAMEDVTKEVATEVEVVTWTANQPFVLVLCLQPTSQLHASQQRYLHAYPANPHVSLSLFQTEFSYSFLFLSSLLKIIPIVHVFFLISSST
jgi:hypothetical protein